MKKLLLLSAFCCLCLPYGYAQIAFDKLDTVGARMLADNIVGSAQIAGKRPFKLVSQYQHPIDIRERIYNYESPDLDSASYNWDMIKRYQKLGLMDKKPVKPKRCRMSVYFERKEGGTYTLRKADGYLENFAAFWVRYIDTTTTEAELHAAGIAEVVRRPYAFRLVNSGRWELFLFPARGNN